MIWILSGVIWLRTHDDGAVRENATLVRQGEDSRRGEGFHERNRWANPLTSAVDQQGVDTPISMSDKRELGGYSILTYRGSIPV